MPIDKDLDALSDKIKSLDNFGYSSILFTFQEYYGDPFTKVVKAIDPKQDIRYMFAVRPYSMTPGYLAMITKSFQEMFGNKIMINLVAGSKKSIMFDINNSSLERKESMGTFAKKYKSIFQLTNFKIKEQVPLIFFSGSSFPIPSMANEYGDGIITDLKNFYEFPEFIKELKNKKLFASLWILCADNYEDAEKQYKFLPDIYQKSTIYGDIDTLMIKIKELSNMGITDLMLLNGSTFALSEAHNVVLKYKTIGDNNV